MLISGPAGVGKEVAARLLHDWSNRAKAPFIVVSAARMTPERVEEELFGVEEGGELARPGLLEQAHGGTLFLDEIADMPIPAQAKILRVLTDQSFTRVGGQRMVKVDMRVVSSTSRHLADEIAGGRFREDLFYRLNVVPVHLPALAERREDIPGADRPFRRPLRRRAEASDARISRPTRSPRCRPMTGPATSASCATSSSAPSSSRPAPGSAASRSTCFRPKSSTSRRASAPGEAVKAIMGTPLREARETFEREYLKVQIRRFSGNISRTATFIGMERSALHRKLKALGIGDTKGEPEE